MTASKTFEIDDNHLLLTVLGAENRHIAVLEEELGLNIQTRGNLITLEGTNRAIRAGEDTLEHLKALAGDAIDIDESAVRAATKMYREGSDTRSKSGREGFAKPVITTKKRRIAARSETQARYLEALSNRDMIFGLGPAGTGKTYLAVAAAVEQILSGQIEKIILCRPAVEAGERLGFLPGDLREKIDPYLRPLNDALYDMLHGDKVLKLQEQGKIEIAPLAYMRGRTLNHAFVILDEAQNATSTQMKMFLTRMGAGARMVVTGDMTQVDLPKGQDSGLNEALRVVEDIPEVSIIKFTGADVVRHKLVTKIVERYEKLQS